MVVARLDFGEYFIPKLQGRGLSQEEMQKRIDIYKPFIDGMNEQEKLHYAREQTYLALGNLANATCAIGLGSCIIGGFYVEEIYDFFELDTSKERKAVNVGVGGRKGGEIPKKKRGGKNSSINFIYYFFKLKKS